MRWGGVGRSRKGDRGCGESMLESLEYLEVLQPWLGVGLP